MARLALVSRNPMMSMALTATTHDVVEVRSFDLDEWLEAGNDADVDALVLDLGIPGTALRLVGDLRARGRWVPVLLVTSAEVGWTDEAFETMPGVDLLSLPLSADKLQAAADAVLRHPRTPPLRRSPDPATPEPAPVSVPEPRHLVSPGPVSDSAPLLDDIPELPTIPDPELLSGAAEPEALSVAERAPEPVREPEPVSGPEPVSEPEPLTDREAAPERGPAPEPEPPAAPVHESNPVSKPELLHVAEPWARSLERRKQEARLSRGPDDLTAAPVERLEEPPTLRLDPRSPMASERPHEPSINSRFAADHAVHELLQVVDGYFTLEETATVIVEDAVSRTDAEAGALLVPDGTLWRVAGGVGLRPLEFRLQLTEESWVITNIAGAGKGVIIEDSDVARTSLHSAPLASRTHLMAAPVAGVRGVLLLARDRAEPFTEASLGALAGLAEEATPLLEQAIQLRELARALAHHVDRDETLRAD